MPSYTLEPAGWLLLLGSWAAVSGLVLFCTRRVLQHAKTRVEEPESSPEMDETR